MKISYSQLSKYLQCPRSYKLYYKDKIRERTISSFLTFGKAMDESLNAILLDLKKNGKVTVDYRKIFDKQWEKTTVNGNDYDSFDCTLIGYHKGEFNEDILFAYDKVLIEEKIVELAPEFTGKDFTSIKKELDERRKNKSTFQVEQHELLNIMNFLSLRRKGHLMLTSYVRDIVPLIEEVVEVQKFIELKTHDGHTSRGVIDIILKFKGLDGHYVVDNKTSSSPYVQEDVRESEQLGSYCFGTGLNKAAYAVMLKAICFDVSRVCKTCKFKAEGKHKTCNNTIDGKRCNGEWDEVRSDPYTKTQLFCDSIEESIQEMIMENFVEVIHGIESEVFPKNLSACKNIFGGVCPYYDLCWHNDKGDLVNLNEPTKKDNDGKT